jgi:hypothetical protein
MRKRTRRSRREQKMSEIFKQFVLSPEEFHCLVDEEMFLRHPGVSPSEEEVEEITRAYQEHIRNSRLFEGWVNEFGLAKAEEMLKECYYEVRPF